MRLIVVKLYNGKEISRWIYDTEHAESVFSNIKKCEDVEQAYLCDGDTGELLDATNDEIKAMVEECGICQE